MIKYEQIREEIKESVDKIMGEESYLCVLYGSKHDVYDEKEDVDICVYAEELTQRQREEIAYEVEKLHKNYGLLFDSDMKYINKTSFSRTDVEEIKNNPPFPVINNRLILAPVNFKRDFLDSAQMRLRLLLNIFTTNSILMYGDTNQFNRIVDEMYEILFNIVQSTSEETLYEEQILERLLYDNSKEYSYKSFLGYDPNDEIQRHYIEKNIKRVLRKRGV